MNGVAWAPQSDTVLAVWTFSSQELLVFKWTSALDDWRLLKVCFWVVNWGVVHCIYLRLSTGLQRTVFVENPRLMAGGAVSTQKPHRVEPLVAFKGSLNCD